MKKLSPELVARMTPEVRAKYESKLRRVKRNRKILTFFLAAVAVAAVAVALSVTVLFNITQINVKQAGNNYTPEQIISASGLDNGDNILRTDFNSVSKRIETNLPYVLSAKINKSLSGTVTISVTDDTPSIIFKVNNGYAVADEKGKVLEILEKEPEKNNLLVLKTSKDMTAAPGQTITFADKNEESLYNEIKESMAAAGLTDITGINISDPTDIYAEYQHRFRLHIGTATQLGEKFESAVKTISIEDESNPNSIGEINLTIVKKVYVEPLDSLDDTTETTAQSSSSTTKKSQSTTKTGTTKSSKSTTVGSTE
jgi:cell division protein FtsQ